MKRIFKSIFVVFVALTMLFGISATAIADDAIVVFKSAQEGFDFGGGSEYGATDLFGNFKNVMPGDKLAENISIRNDATDCDYIKLYIRAVPHDEIDNPLSDEVAESETVASMKDFLAQLTMRIYNGEALIYEASPDQAGALANNVLLGTLYPEESLTLRVELDVPLELGNEYAHRMGEVDWVFLAECIELEKLTVHKVWDDNGYPERPSSVKVKLLRDGEAFEEAELSEENQWTYAWDELDDRYSWTVEEEVPAGYTASYQTEDNRVFITNHMDYEPPIPPEPIDITVTKVWSDEEDRQNIRPDSVTVTLYNGKKAVEKVTLSEKNGWTYTWTDLDGSGDWSVLETGIPKGYTPSYKTKDGVVTITNTATLIQTGQLNWPIPVFGGLGLLMVVFGILIIFKKRKEEDEQHEEIE